METAARRTRSAPWRAYLPWLISESAASVFSHSPTAFSLLPGPQAEDSVIKKETRINWGHFLACPLGSLQRQGGWAAGEHSAPGNSFELNFLGTGAPCVCANIYKLNLKTFVSASWCGLAFVRVFYVGLSCENKFAFSWGPMLVCCKWTFLAFCTVRQLLCYRWSGLCWGAALMGCALRP